MDKKIVKSGGYALPISFKYSVEVARWLKRRSLKQIFTLLNEVLEYKKAVPIKRYKKDVPHKPGKGMAAGKYPIKVAKYFLAIFKNMLNNSKFLYNIDDPEKIFVDKIIVNRTFSKRMLKRMGRKMTNVYVEGYIIEKNEGEKNINKKQG